MKYHLYSGAGNTFALTEKPVSSQDAVELCSLCQADGVIFSEEASIFRMRIFNRDGSEAEMCGNGLRCFIKHLMQQNIHQECYTIETLAGIQKAWANGSRICVQLSPPKDIRWNLKIGPYTVHHLNTGVPHAVLFAESIDEMDLMEIGPAIRRHPSFPKGVNVNLVDSDSLRLRTYERGVEAETPACGTGAAASALAAAKLFNLSSPLEMLARSGEKLKISFTSDWKTVTLEGSANKISEGTFRLKDKSPILSPL